VVAAKSNSVHLAVPLKSRSITRPNLLSAYLHMELYLIFYSRCKNQPDLLARENPIGTVEKSADITLCQSDQSELNDP
jgi:hypothetical protein